MIAAANVSSGQNAKYSRRVNGFRSTLNCGHGGHSWQFSCVPGSDICSAANWSLLNRPRRGAGGSRNGTLWNIAGHSALMLAARITLPHFSVSAAISLPKSAGDPGSAVPPNSSSALILGSASAADLHVELVDNLGGRIPRRPEAERAGDLLAGHGVARRRKM
jgi:hypothetical protein